MIIKVKTFEEFKTLLGLGIKEVTVIEPLENNRTSARIVSPDDLPRMSVSFRHWTVTEPRWLVECEVTAHQYVMLLNKRDEERGKRGQTESKD